jgi:broad specificity phosphatase PhoE
MCAASFDTPFPRIYLYLSRHGETIWNTQSRMQGRGDSALTERGITDAIHLAEKLAQMPLLAAFCSPAKRAQETMRMALSGRGIPVIADERIHEMALGVYEGLTVQEAYQLDHDNMDAFFYHPERFIPVEGESFPDVVTRIRSFLDELTDDPVGLIRRHSGIDIQTDECHILIISHNITIKTMLAIMQNRPMAMLRDGPQIPQASLIPVLYDRLSGKYQLLPSVYNVLQ